MKNFIHPKLFNVLVLCYCGNSFYIFTTIKLNINTDSCSGCHSFYTGKYKDISNIGRVGKFNNKYKNIL